MAQEFEAEPTVAPAHGLQRGSAPWTRVMVPTRAMPLASSKVSASTAHGTWIRRRACAAKPWSSRCCSYRSNQGLRP